MRLIHARVAMGWSPSGNFPLYFSLIEIVKESPLLDLAIRGRLRKQMHNTKDLTKYLIIIRIDNPDMLKG